MIIDKNTTEEIIEDNSFTNDVVERIKEISNLLNISDRDVLTFLSYAINSDETQIWILKNELKGNKLSFNDELKYYFLNNANEKIIQYYKIYKNTNEANIESIRQLIK